MPSNYPPTKGLPRLDPGEVKAARAQLGLTQLAFASMLCVSMTALRSWENGRSACRGPAGVLIRLLLREPELASDITSLGMDAKSTALKKAIGHLAGGGRVDTDMQQLADESDLDLASAYAALDELINRGLVRRLHADGSGHVIIEPQR